MDCLTIRVPECESGARDALHSRGTALPSRSMKPYLVIAAVFAALTPAAQAQSADEITRHLKRLQSPDIEVRREAIDGIQLSLDPRIPDACLPLLSQEGDSIRRLAARAIGSRWHQISAERAPVFIAALKAQLQSEHEGLVNMARRGIALLSRDYRSPMVSRSRSKRFVIYERHGLPCLIDTGTMTEELLGFPSDADMACAWGNGELAPTVKWHPKKEMVVMEMLGGRKFSTAWAWIHGVGLRQLDADAQIKALGLKEGDVHHAGGWFATPESWEGDSVRISLSYMTMRGDDFLDHEAVLLWSPATQALKVLANAARQ